MNWMSKRAGTVVTEDYDGKCEHLEIGDTAYRDSLENDSLGPPEAYHMCKACAEKMDNDIDNSEENCRDCGTLAKLKDMTVWVPFDFDPRQGDEPIHICDDCCKLPKHIKRVADYERDVIEEEEYNDSRYW